MPQTLIQTPKDAGQALDVNGRSLIASHEQITSILRSRLGANHADLLARPLPQSDGSIAWSTSLAGTVAPAEQLADDERAKLEKRVERLRVEIGGLAQQLKSEGPASQIVGHMIERALLMPPGQWLYSVGGKPVLAMWGHAATGAAAPPPVVTAAPVAAPAAAAPVAAAPAATAAPVAEPLAGGGVPPGATPPPVAPPSRDWKRWLLWALAALLLLALLFIGWRCSLTTVADAGLVDQIAQAEARNRALEEQLAAQRKSQFMCVPEPPQPVASAPTPVASAPAPVASAPEAPPSAPATPPSRPAPSPLDELKKRIADAGNDCNALSRMLDAEPLLRGGGAQAADLKQQIMQSMQRNCRDRAISEAKNLCPGERPKELAPESVIVFDASGSMNYSLDATDREIEQYGQAAAVEEMMRQFGLGRLGGNAAAAMQRLTREPKRITVAKQATQSVVQRMPSDTTIGLVMVDACPSARPIGHYAPAQRGALLGQIQAIQPRQGTPLADGIAKGGSMVDGVNREALMIVVSDGVESCGSDPCATASALKRAKPHLKINVVDITGTGAGNCVAQATGGKVFTARNADEVVAMTERAAREAMGPEGCKR